MKAEFLSPDSEAEALLTGAGLPVSAIRDRPVLRLLGIRERCRLKAMVGIEVHGDVALLHSLAVARDRRRSGLGRALVADAEQWAIGQGVRSLFVPAASAERFFGQLGYAVVAREDAPEAISTTTQFVELCSASSILMRKDIPASAGA